MKDIKIGIIAAMPEELDYILEQAGEKIRVERGFTEIFKTSFGKIECVMAVSGIGAVNAAILAQQMIDLDHVDIIINTGVAGTLSPEIKLLDLVLAEDCVYYDVADDFLIDYPPYSAIFPTSKKLREAILKLSKNKNIFLGRIASGNDFVSTTAQKDEIVKQTEAVAVDMESCPIAQVCYVNRISFISLRSISDLADEGVEGNYSAFKHKAAQQSASIVLALLTDLEL